MAAAACAGTQARRLLRDGSWCGTYADIEDGHAVCREIIVGVLSLWCLTLWCLMTVSWVSRKCLTTVVSYAMVSYAVVSVSYAVVSYAVVASFALASYDYRMGSVKHYVF